MHKNETPFGYKDWIAGIDTLSESDLATVRSMVSLLNDKVNFRIVIWAQDASRLQINRTLKSLQAQCFRSFECVLLGVESVFSDSVKSVPADGLAGWLETFNASLTHSSSPAWVIRVRAGDTLAPHALFCWAVSAVNASDEAVIYSDDDQLDSNGERYAPRFKPDWSLAHMRSTNYLGDAVAVRADALAVGHGLEDDDCRDGLFDKVLQVVDLKSEDVIHLQSVLLHRGAVPPPDAAAREMHAVQRHLMRRGISATVSPTRPGCRRIRYQLPASLPLVTIIIPTRDALALLRRCIDSVLAKTTYARYEILVVDNQSRDPATLAYLQEIAGHPVVRVLSFDRSFNFSAINNFAAGEAGGDLLCLLNNDTEVITPDWLDEMVGNLLQDQVGVVGAKLFFPDGRVQHGGDTVGVGGCANHLHKGIDRDDPGYCNRAVVAQGLSAVTGACLLTRRKLYLDLGGLDARWLRVAFNDVDYCLRVRAAGWQVVWTPHAELFHHESVSRGKNDSRRKKLRAGLESIVMRKRWRHVMRNDPFYNPNLNRNQPDFTPGRTRRIKRPWD